MSTTVEVMPEVIDTATYPVAEFEVGEVGMYLHVANVTVDLDTASSDVHEQAANLDRCAKVLQALADDLARAQAEVSAARAMLGERCETCHGHGGHPVYRRFVGEDWDECPYCDGTGRTTTPEAAA